MSNLILGPDGKPAAAEPKHRFREYHLNAPKELADVFEAAYERVKNHAGVPQKPESLEDFLLAMIRNGIQIMTQVMDQHDRQNARIVIPNGPLPAGTAERLRALKGA